MIGSAMTARPMAQGSAMSAMVRMADSSVPLASASSLRVSAAVMAGIQEMVIVVMKEHGRAKMVCWKV